MQMSLCSGYKKGKKVWGPNIVMSDFRIEQKKDKFDKLLQDPENMNYSFSLHSKK
jgi:hypothetical protein